MSTKIILLTLALLMIAACAAPFPAAIAPTQSSAVEAPPMSTSAPASAPALIPAGREGAYWVINPSSGARLAVTVLYPDGWNGELLPALILVPGGTGVVETGKARALAAEGFLAIIFTPDGRGASDGSEDYNGHIGQDGLAAAIQASLSLPGLDPGRFGLVSYSYGVTLASGALARHPDLPIDFYIDWEGPVDRGYTTTGCGPNRPEGIQWQPCSEDAWWAEREAIRFIGEVRVPYQRIQSQKDHVQRGNTHAIEIVNAAAQAGLPWVRLNEYPPNQTYDAANPPAMLADAEDKRLQSTVAEYAWHIIREVLPAQ